MGSVYYALVRIPKPGKNQGFWERGDKVEGADKWPNVASWVRTRKLGLEPVDVKPPAPSDKPKPKAAAKKRAAAKPKAAAKKRAAKSKGKKPKPEPIDEGQEPAADDAVAADAPA
jgi:hypothetical protein